MRDWIARFFAAPASAVATQKPPLTQAAAQLGETADQILRRLEWTVIRRLDGLLQGDHHTLMRGGGVDLADVREYQLHDDVRHMDWNVTARLQVPHVREFTEDREMTAWFLLDLSPSVDFGSGTRRKSNLSMDFVAVLARLLTKQGNRIGAVLYGSGVDEVLPAGSGRSAVLRLMHAMKKRPPPPGVGVLTPLHDLLHAGANLVKRRSTLFVVSDFVSSPGWEKSLRLLSQKHEVVAVRLTDPLESELPDLGLITMQDLEIGEQLLVDTHNTRFRQRFAQLVAQRETHVRGALASAGVDTLELSTSDDLTRALVRFTDLRKQRRRVRSGAVASHLIQVA